MQVRKFEAKSMKEALALVKLNMGPEAIILSVKDHSQRFGLKGQTSVEITAAASEKSLRLKELAEKKLTEAAKQKFRAAPATRQQEFIQSSYTKQLAPKAKLPATLTPYIEIIDDDSPTQSVAESRVKGATQRAFETLQALEPLPPVTPPNQTYKRVQREEDSELRALRKEISHLKSMLTKFSQVPQDFITRHPGAEFDLPFELSQAFEKMVRVGLDTSHVVELLREAKNSLPFEQIKKPALVKAWLAKKLLDRLLLVEDRFSSFFHCFVGPSGQGKTSTLVKMASDLVICKKKKICILSTDVSKPGAAEQLKIYAKILNVPFAVLRKSQDWKMIQPAMQGLDHVLVDFPGLNLKSTQELDWLHEILPKFEQSRSVHFVQSLMVNEREALEIARRYQPQLVNDIVFTGLDLAARHGLIFNIQNALSWPLHSFGIGASIPEDLEPATKERVIDLIFKISGKFDQTKNLASRGEV